MIYDLCAIIGTISLVALVFTTAAIVDLLSKLCDAIRENTEVLRDDDSGEEWKK